MLSMSTFRIGLYLYFPEDELVTDMNWSRKVFEER